MNNFETLMSSKMRTASRLSAAILTTTAFALLPAMVHAQDPASQSRPVMSSAQYEQQVERSCADWEKVRRCANAAGEVQLECAAKSPMAKLWAMLRGERKRDDEVRVEVIRRAPDDSAAAASEKQANARQERGAVVEGRHTTRVVKTGELPRCQGNG